jgi:abortive infection bacteriophage resistance protein
MKKFWQWMDKKGHGCFVDSIFMLKWKYKLFNKKCEGIANEPSKQMLIGYMIEYLCEMNYCVPLFEMDEVGNYGTMEQYYERLKQKIEESG